MNPTPTPKPDERKSLPQVYREAYNAKLVFTPETFEYERANARHIHALKAVRNHAQAVASASNRELSKLVKDLRHLVFYSTDIAEDVKDHFLKRIDAAISAPAVEERG